MLFIYFREGKGGEKRGRGTATCKRSIDRLPLTHPQLGTWPTTQACALTGNRTGDLSLCRMTLNPLNHAGQCLKIILEIK